MLWLSSSRLGSFWPASALHAGAWHVWWSCDVLEGQICQGCEHMVVFEVLEGRCARSLPSHSR